MISIYRVLGFVVIVTVWDLLLLLSRGICYIELFIPCMLCVVNLSRIKFSICFLYFGRHPML